MKKAIPKHIAITMSGIRQWAEQHGRKEEEAYRVSFNVLNELIKTQVKLNIPIISVLVMAEKDTEEFSPMSDAFLDFLNGLKSDPLILNNKMKVVFIGKWYDLPGRIVEAIRTVIETTKNHDTFFLNLCINYDGHEEIVDATKLVVRKILAGKLDVESVNKDRIKENLYSSYLLRPELIIKTGMKQRLGTFLLWDAAYAEIMFPKILWPDFNEAEFRRCFTEGYQKL
jgi:undecaprenyl diphosphate synthase